MSPLIARRSLEMLRKGAPQAIATEIEDYNLSKREIEILEQLSKGLTYTVIADNLFISPGTVRKHIENIYRKLQVSNKVEALKVAGKSGLI
jgi:DNA-binding NarL/FixJ family response regulator